MQDRREQARERFERLMAGPDAIVAVIVMAALTWPLWMAFDNLTVGKPVRHEEAAFLVIAAAIAIPAYLVIRLAAAAIIAAITARRAVGHQEAPPQTRRLISSAPL